MCGMIDTGASMGRKIPAPIQTLPEESGGPRGVASEGDSLASTHKCTNVLYLEKFDKAVSCIFVS